MKGKIHMKFREAARIGYPGLKRLSCCLSLLSVILISARSQADLYTEKIFLHTDRDYYITGEDIHFKAYISTGNEMDLLSRILYVELKDLGQNRIDHQAYLIAGDQVTGKIRLPDSLRSGSYIMSASTNWHRNFDNRYAFRKEVILVNRFGVYGQMRGESKRYGSSLFPGDHRIVLEDSLHLIRISLPGETGLTEHWCNIYCRGVQVWSQELIRDPHRNYLIELEKARLPGGLLKIEIRSRDTLIGTAFLRNVKECGKMSVQTDSLNYGTRNPVEVTLRLEGFTSDSLSANLSMSVFSVPEGYPYQTHLPISEWFDLYSEFNPCPEFTEEHPAGDLPCHSWIFDEARTYVPVYPLEAEGRIVSGRVVESRAGSAIEGALVFFSFIDTLPYLDYDMTDSTGYFHFNIPANLHCNPGIVQIWHMPEGNSGGRIIFEDPHEAILPGGNILMQASAEELANMFSTQIKVFETGKLFEDTPAPTSRPSDAQSGFHAIYAGYNLTVFPADYVRLYNFGEIVKEILPGVQMKKEPDGISVRIMDEFRNIYFEEEPLVIVNGLPFRDYNFLATLSSDDIERIDIVRRLFAVGALIFPGVLSVELKDGIRPDYLAGHTYYPVNSEIVAPSAIMIPDKDRKEYNRPKRLPDLRNTLLWEPDLKMNHPEQKVRLHTGDQPGRYRILVEGLINGTMPVSASCEFSVHAVYQMKNFQE